MFRLAVRLADYLKSRFLSRIDSNPGVYGTVLVVMLPRMIDGDRLAALKSDRAHLDFRRLLFAFDVHAVSLVKRKHFRAFGSKIGKQIAGRLFQNKPMREDVAYCTKVCDLFVMRHPSCFQSENYHANLCAIWISRMGNVTCTAQCHCTVWRRDADQKARKPPFRSTPGACFGVNALQNRASGSMGRDQLRKSGLRPCVGRGSG